MTRLSVLTISYRDPSGLSETLRSLEPLNALATSWQHIVVDSSPDMNGPVLERLRDWPLVHLTTPPRGIYEAFNEGLRALQGDFVWILNGGDRLRDTGALQRLLHRMTTRPELDMLCAAADLTRDGEFLYTHFPARTFEESILGANRICQQAVIYRRSALSAVGEFSTAYRIAGDFEHHLRCYMAKLNVECCDDRLIEYDMDGLSTDWRAAIAEFRGVLDEMRDRLPVAFYCESRVRAELEFVRLWTVKRLAKSRVASMLYPFWISWHRAKARHRRFDAAQ